MRFPPAEDLHVLDLAGNLPGFPLAEDHYMSSTFSTTRTWSPRTVMGMGTTDS
jgi:hypothetical protein